VDEVGNVLWNALGTHRQRSPEKKNHSLRGGLFWATYLKQAVKAASLRVGFERVDSLQVDSEKVHHF
jgi:hypothetical protein